MTDGTGVTSYSYDSFSRLTKEEKGSIIKTYTYDHGHNRKTFSIQNGSTQQMNTVYTYDKLNRVETVTNGTKQTTYRYNKNSSLEKDTSDGFITDYTYTVGGLVSGLETKKGTTVVQTHRYTYHEDGNLYEKYSKVGAKTSNNAYFYDTAGRLYMETVIGEMRQYTYDEFGNRESMQANQDMVNYRYDKNNRLIEMSTEKNGVEEITSYSYDPNGNQISRNKSTYSTGGTPEVGFETDGSDFALYSYDLMNRLKSFTNGVNTASYTYDGNNLRQTKTVNGVTKTHVWDGANMVMETGDNITNRYYRGATGIIYGEIEGRVSYYHKDSHGDVMALTDVNGVNTSTHFYGAYGDEPTWRTTRPPLDESNPFRYCGEYFDDESGLIYLRNRYYEPTSGRFITEDPIRSGMNWYIYAANNPIRYIDPSGLVITLTGTNDERQRSFDQLQMLTNDELTYHKETGVVTILNTGTMNTDKTLTAGSKMVADLIANDDYNTKIERINSADEGNYTWYEDGGATIQMNDWCEAGENWFYAVSDGAGGIAYDDHKDVAHIILGHELIHSTHWMNNEIDDTYNGVYLGVGTFQRSKPGVFNNEEFNTVGFNYHRLHYDADGWLTGVTSVNASSRTLTENVLRAEHGLSARVLY